MTAAPAGTPLPVFTRNIPRFVDFFLGIDHYPNSRPGIDLAPLLHCGGFRLFVGRYHLEVDIHVLCAVLRWLRPRGVV